MNEADSQRAWDPLEKKYISYDPDAASEVRWQKARCEQDAPLPETSETEKRLLEIDAAIAAIPLDPSWTMPQRESQRHSDTIVPWRIHQQHYATYSWMDNFASEFVLKKDASFTHIPTARPDMSVNQ